MGGLPQARRIGAAAGWSLFLAASLAGGEPVSRQGLFPPHATVVLLAGVPGDVESEGNYRDQMQNWVALATGSGQVARVFVLCDEPQAVAVPANPSEKAGPGEGAGVANGQSPIANRPSAVTVLKGDRGSFLRLTAR